MKPSLTKIACLYRVFILTGPPLTLPGTEGLGDRWESPSKCPFNRVQVGLGGIGRRGGARGEGGAEHQWWRKEFARRGHSGGDPLLKTPTWRGEIVRWQKMKVLLYFCFVNCCNTSWLLLLIGSRLLKLLWQQNSYHLESLLISLFTFFLLQQTNTTSLL